ncbi:IMPACT family protein [Kytococcus sedentarius]|uniref:IMPACT family protein n=1 Tax=Kytococcus sedentarius TaxID=1276 RepID=UPI0035BC5C6D
MPVTSYRTLARDAHGEIEEKNSRFVCRIAPSDSEEAARAVIEAERRTHHDARHHCSAFILGPDGRIERSNDDGEPAGTAGTPMLDVLRGSGYRDVTAVVTRWFGGTKLGAGGLVRAYGDAVRAALEDARPRERHLVRLHALAVAHADAGRIENDLRAAGFVVTGTDYAERATLHVATPPDQQDALAALVAATTSGGGVLEPGPEQWVDTP